MIGVSGLADARNLALLLVAATDTDHERHRSLLSRHRRLDGRMTPIDDAVTVFIAAFQDVFFVGKVAVAAARSQRGM